MTRSLDEANREISRISEMPYGLARTQAAERQVRLVEAEGPDGARAFALSVLVQSLFWGGESERAYLPFTLLVRWWDERPELFDDIDQHSLFWFFKWMVTGLADFPTVPVTQIDATLDDMERRYAIAGHGRDAVAHCRFTWAAERGTADVEPLYQEWVATPRDDFSQCAVCEPGDRAAYLLASGRPVEAVRLIEQTLAEGGTCATEPADMLSHLALAYLDLGRPDDAARTHRRAVAALPDAHGEMIGARGRRIVLLGRGGQASRAVRAIEEDARLLVAAETPSDRLRFLLAVVDGTAALLPAHADDPVDAGVPAATLGALHAWAVAEAEPLVAAFDARNGTARNADRLAAARASRPSATPVDLELHLDPVAPTPSVAVPAPVTGGAPAAPDDLAVAEQALADGRIEDAAHAYARAATAAQDAGLLVDAGFAAAEAARCAQLLDDDGSADTLYARAVSLLRAADVAATDVVPVVVAWAPAAVRSERPAVFRDASDALAAALTREPEVAAEAPGLGRRREHERRRALADLDDVTARVLASLGESTADEAVTDEAIERAGRAAEAFAGLGSAGDAAHAFWLAGRLLDARGRTEDAVWHLESAVEGFGLARDRGSRARAADDLVALLRRTGQDARAEEVLASLSS